MAAMHGLREMYRALERVGLSMDGLAELEAMNDVEERENAACKFIMMQNNPVLIAVRSLITPPRLGSVERYSPKIIADVLIRFIRALVESPIDHHIIRNYILSDSGIFFLDGSFERFAQIVTKGMGVEHNKRLELNLLLYFLFEFKGFPIESDEAGGLRGQVTEAKRVWSEASKTYLERTAFFAKRRRKLLEDIRGFLLIALDQKWKACVALEMRRGMARGSDGPKTIDDIHKAVNLSLAKQRFWWLIVWYLNRKPGFANYVSEIIRHAWEQNTLAFHPLFLQELVHYPLSPVEVFAELDVIAKMRGVWQIRHQLDLRGKSVEFLQAWKYFSNFISVDFVDLSNLKRRLLRMYVGLTPFSDVEAALGFNDMICLNRKELRLMFLHECHRRSQFMLFMQRFIAPSQCSELDESFSEKFAADLQALEDVVKNVSDKYGTEQESLEKIAEIAANLERVRRSLDEGVVDSSSFVCVLPYAKGLAKFWNRLWVTGKNYRHVAISRGRGVDARVGRGAAAAAAKDLRPAARRVGEVARMDRVDGGGGGASAVEGAAMELAQQQARLAVAEAAQRQREREAKAAAEAAQQQRKREAEAAAELERQRRAQRETAEAEQRRQREEELVREKEQRMVAERRRRKQREEARAAERLARQRAQRAVAEAERRREREARAAEARQQREQLARMRESARQERELARRAMVEVEQRRSVEAAEQRQREQREEARAVERLARQRAQQEAAEAEQRRRERVEDILADMGVKKDRRILEAGAADAGQSIQQRRVESRIERRHQRAESRRRRVRQDVLLRATQGRIDEEQQRRVESLVDRRIDEAVAQALVAQRALRRRPSGVELAEVARDVGVPPPAYDRLRDEDAVRGGGAGAGAVVGEQVDVVAALLERLRRQEEETDRLRAQVEELQRSQRPG